MPSEILHIEDEYLAFCFDEACGYIVSKLEERDKQGNLVNKPKWLDERENVKSNNNKELIEWMKKHSK